MESGHSCCAYRLIPRAHQMTMMQSGRVTHLYSASCFMTRREGEKVKGISDISPFHILVDPSCNRPK